MAWRRNIWPQFFEGQNPWKGLINKPSVHVVKFLRKGHTPIYIVRLSCILDLIFVRERIERLRSAGGLFLAIKISTYLKQISDTGKMVAPKPTAFFDPFALMHNWINVLIIVVVNVFGSVFLRINGTIKTVSFATIKGLTIIFWIYFFWSIWKRKKIFTSLERKLVGFGSLYKIRDLHPKPYLHPLRLPRHCHFQPFPMQHH